MKKSAILICTLCVLLCTISVFAAPVTDEYSDCSDFLTKLEILLPGDSITLKADTDSVTRGEFAILAYRALGGKAAGDGQAYFYDVAENSAEYTAANTLAQLGVLNGNGQGIFNPDDTIELYDALAVMLRLMGYQNPQKLSNEIFVTKTCSSYDLLDRNDLTSVASDKKTILTLYTKLLSVEVMDIDYIGYTPDTVIDYSVHEDSLLSRYFNIFKEEGILVSNGIVNINGENADSERITVGDVEAKTSKPVALPAGAEVDLYYTDSSSKELFAVYLDEINEFVTLDYNNLVDLYDGGYEYEENGKIKKLSVDSRNATYIYNNSLLTDSSDKLLLPSYASIDFIDSDGNGKYDIVDIKSYMSFLVSWVYEEDGVYSVASNDGTTVYIDEEEPCMIKDSTGIPVAAGDIAAGIVASCAVVEKNIDGNIRLYAKDIILSDKRITGAVSSVMENDGTVESVFVDENEYKVYPQNQKLHTLISPTGSSAVFCLDFLGNIVDMNYNSTLADVAVGFVIDVGTRDTGMNGDRASLYVFDELERVREYVFAEKTVVNGETVKNPGYTLFENLVGEVILFRVDEKDEISYIDTAAEYAEDMTVTSKNTLVKLGNSENSYNSGGLYYNSGCKAFDGSVNIDNYTMILSVPTVLEGADKSEYRLLTINDLTGGARYMVEGYGTDPESVVSDILVVRDLPVIKGNTDIAVVTQIGTALNKDGIETYSLHLQDKNGKRVYPLANISLINAYADIGGDITSTTPRVTVQTGDLVRYKVDENSEIEQLMLTYDLSEDSVKDRCETTERDLRYYYYYTVRTFTAVPYSINDGFLRITRPGAQSYTINDFENISFDNIQNVFYIDKNRDKITVTKIAPSAIKTVKTNGTLDSKMIVNIVSQSRVNIFIYDEEVR